MKKKNLKISTQLLIGFSLVLTFVVILGLVSSIQTNRLFQQERTLYEHPLQVKDAIDEIKSDILETRVGVRDFILYDNDTNKQQALQMVELSLADVEKQFDVLYELYLGPITDLDSAYTSFVLWKTATKNRFDMAQTGSIEEIVESLGDQGDVGTYRVRLMSDIKAIDDFANSKASELNDDFFTYYQSLITGRISLVAVIMILSVLISVYLIQVIRKPLFDLNHQIKRFRQGELDARCEYLKDNEFGALSVSFNNMADAIQTNVELSEKAASLSRVMLSQEESGAFFRALLEELTRHLGANTAAVYLLSKDEKTFVCYDSIGLDGKARESFDAQLLEGEFGSVISSHKTQYIRQIPEKTRFRFLVSSGQFTPREMITIPIGSGNKIIAILSLTCVSSFYEHATKLIESVVDTMSARVEGILAFQTIKDMLEKLELQNRELDAQKNELTAQANELMQQNAELDMQSSQLAEASRLKTSFLSNMSHELRTPLNSIIALSGVLNRRLAQQIPEEELSYLEIVERNGKHLLSLINDILDISRIEAGREELEITDFSINRVLAEIAAMMEPLAAQKGIQLIQQLGDKELYLASDEPKCRHILQNIISNAVKFVETGSVEITARQIGETIQITVTDTGIGIAEEHLASIFDEFKQADGTMSRRYGGTGLGLAIAKKYTDFLGGSISVTSELGKGSEFTVTLPLRCDEGLHTVKSSLLPDTRSHTEKKPAFDQSIVVSEKTILLIEDSESAIIQIKDLIEQSGHKVLVAHCASEAYTIVDDIIPDAIILDLMMPDIDGFETLNTLRSVEKTANIPVLILTAKFITKEELGLLRRNHIHQVVQKGSLNRSDLFASIMEMFTPAPSEAVLSEERKNAASEKPVILIVEDNADNMTTAKALLKDKYRILEATNGENAIRIAKKHIPDLILMDIALPGISGIDAFQAIRNTPTLQHISVIALTASAMTQERASILAYGFEAFISKPINSEEFLKVIGEVLYGR